MIKGEGNSEEEKLKHEEEERFKKRRGTKIISPKKV